MAALKAAGCERIFREKASGGRWDRPELHRLLDQLRKSDVLVVWKLDRLSRSLRDVLTIMERLGEAQAGFRSLTEAIDTTTPAGRMMMQMVGAFAEFERAMLRERTKSGLDAARQEGRIGGRRPSCPLSNRPKFARWFRRVTRQPPMPPAYSKSTRPRSPGCWLRLTPNSVQSFTPDNLQSDTSRTALRLHHRPNDSQRDIPLRRRNSNRPLISGWRAGTRTPILRLESHCRCHPGQSAQITGRLL